MPFLRNEFPKIFENLIILSITEIIYIYDQTKKIKAKDLRLTFMRFWNLLPIKCQLENYYKYKGLTSPFRQREA